METFLKADIFFVITAVAVVVLSVLVGVAVVYRYRPALVEDLFEIHGVRSVQLMPQRIRFEMESGVNWEGILPKIILCLEGYFDKGADVECPGLDSY
jgi:hypothetical protein